MTRRESDSDSSVLLRIREGSDPLAGLRKYIEHGGSLRSAERMTGVPRTTLQRYLTQGLPAPATDALHLISTFRRDGRIRR